MFERFDPDCRLAVARAQDEARRLRHPFIGTEHLLIGLLQDEHGDPVRRLADLGVDPADVRRRLRAMMGDGLDPAALSLLGIDLDQVRAAVESRFGAGSLDSGGPLPELWGHLPLTRRCKVVLRLTLRSAQRLGHSRIRPAHLMLGLLADGGGVAVQALQDCGVDLVALRAALITGLASEAA